MRRYYKMGCLLLLALFGCAGHGYPQPSSPPRITKTSIKPASITISPATGWSAAPTNGHMPVYTDLDTAIQFFPPPLIGSLIIQRRGADTGYLDGKVSVPSAATLYVALALESDGQTLITTEQFAAFVKEGWARVPGIFTVVEPRVGGESRNVRWQVWSHLVDRGSVTINSKAIPSGGIFFIGRVR